jgi:hypothetical protein
MLQKEKIKAKKQLGYKEKKITQSKDFDVLEPPIEDEPEDQQVVI